MHKFYIILFGLIFLYNFAISQDIKQTFYLPIDNKVDSLVITYHIKKNKVIFKNQYGNQILPDSFYPLLIKEIETDLDGLPMDEFLFVLEFKTYIYLYKKIKEINIDKKKIRKCSY